jgi:hypothetical protein
MIAIVREDFIDGFSVSVQASRRHYCSPKDDVGPYREVEVGFRNADGKFAAPGFLPPEWNDCGREADGGIYTYVPIRLIEALIGAIPQEMPTQKLAFNVKELGFLLDGLRLIHMDFDSEELNALEDKIADARDALALK